MNSKPWYAIALAEDGRSATIAVRGKIGDWWEGKSIEQIDYDLANIGAVDQITVRITSFGGKLDHGLAMHNALRRHPARIITVVEGVAASAGSIVAMAGDEIHMYANSTMMVHGVTLRDDEGNEVEDDDATRALNASIVETYSARTGKTADEVAALIATDTWMTAREALAAGFADRVIEIAAGELATATAASPLTAIAAALDIPADVLARAQAEATAPATSEGGDPPAAPAAPAPTPPAVQPAGADASATFAAQINAHAVAHGLGDYVAAWLLDGSITNLAQAQAAIAEAREVRDLCAYADAADRAPGFIRARKSLADVRADLLNARADAADALHIDGHPSTRKPPVTAAPAAVKTADIWALRRKP
ncbi:head maturation protease, ClpP-related [Aromatoleum aromaticum]|nr:head maturation protease, ClpP-related [Aromatoleum aromaticum]